MLRFFFKDFIANTFYYAFSFPIISNPFQMEATSKGKNLLQEKLLAPLMELEANISRTELSSLEIFVLHDYSPMPAHCKMSKPRNKKKKKKLYLGIKT